MVAALVACLAEDGIPLAWFGGPCRGFTSTARDCQFAGAAPPEAHGELLARELERRQLEAAVVSSNATAQLDQVARSRGNSVASAGEAGLGGGAERPT